MTDIDQLIQTVAFKHATTAEDVRKEIEYAIRIAISDPDPKVQQFWKEVPCEHEIPTVEEVLIFLTQKIADEI